jgi:hypothetical protein
LRQKDRREIEREADSYRDSEMEVKDSDREIETVWRQRKRVRDNHIYSIITL